MTRIRIVECALQKDYITLCCSATEFYTSVINGVDGYLVVYFLVPSVERRFELLALF